MKIYLYSIMIVMSAQLNLFSDEVVQRKELNDAMAERAALMVKAHQSEEKLAKAWSDKEFTSAEIEKLRERYQKLSFEMIEVREKLKSEVAKLPEVQQTAEEVKAMRVRQEALEKKIKELNR